MKLTMWLKERELNARRLAAGRTGADRAGWLEDADHFQAALAAVEERDKLRAALDRALTVCRCAARVIDSSAYQGISDEDCDLEVSVRNWRALGPN